MQKLFGPSVQTSKESLHKVLFNSIKRKQRYFEFKLDVLIQTEKQTDLVLEMTPQRGSPKNILWVIYLKHFVKCFKDGHVPKKAIIFVTKLEHLMEIREFLQLKLGHLEIVKNINTRPWVINHSAAGNVTIDHIRERSANPDVTTWD